MLQQNDGQIGTGTGTCRSKYVADVESIELAAPLLIIARRDASTTSFTRQVIALPGSRVVSRLGGSNRLQSRPRFDAHVEPSTRSRTARQTLCLTAFFMRLRMHCLAYIAAAASLASRDFGRIIRSSACLLDRVRPSSLTHSKPTITCSAGKYFAGRQRLFRSKTLLRGRIDKRFAATCINHHRPVR